MGHKGEGWVKALVLFLSLTMNLPSQELGAAKKMEVHLQVEAGLD